MSRLGEALRTRREELGIGQEAVAERLGVSQQTVSRWEKGLAVPRPARVVALAALLDCDPAHLHRLAGHLPAAERSARGEPLPADLSRLTRTELLVLIDRAWQELRAREGLPPPGAA